MKIPFKDNGNLVEDIGNGNLLQRRNYDASSSCAWSIIFHPIQLPVFVSCSPQLTPLPHRSLLPLDTIFRNPSMIALNSSNFRSINSISFHQSLFRIHFHNLKLSLVLERLSSGNPGVLAGRFAYQPSTL